MKFLAVFMFIASFILTVSAKAKVIACDSSGLSTGLSGEILNIRYDTQTGQGFASINFKQQIKLYKLIPAEDVRSIEGNEVLDFQIENSQATATWNIDLMLIEATEELQPGRKTQRNFACQ